MASEESKSESAEAAAQPTSADEAQTASAPEGAEAPPAESAEAPPEAAALPPIIIKKVQPDGHGGAHGGAWKIALADMMTAMMAFFLLMWLLGATNSDQRKAIADYFRPTSVVTMNSASGGAKGFFGGQSIIEPQALPQQSSQTGLVQISAPGTEEKESTHEDMAKPEGFDNKPADVKKTQEATQNDDKSQAKGNPKNLSEQEKQKIAAEQDNKAFKTLESEVTDKLSKDKGTQRLLSVVKFIKEKEGLRIEILDNAQFSMFASGTANIAPQAKDLIAKVAASLRSVPNELAIRGHTDSYRFANGSNNNWALSASRADATRQYLNSLGIDDSRFSRIEGVADSQPVNASDPLDPKNRRISITVLYRNTAPAKPE
jgi:chemotaxis protein MotB